MANAAADIGHSNGLGPVIRSSVLTSPSTRPHFPRPRPSISRGGIGPPDHHLGGVRVPRYPEGQSARDDLDAAVRYGAGAHIPAAFVTRVTVDAPPALGENTVRATSSSRDRHRGAAGGAEHGADLTDEDYARLVEADRLINGETVSSRWASSAVTMV
jgi:hypothetical protein